MYKKLKGIKTNEYYLKLCGSGGGGYILGFRVGDHVFYDEIMGHALFLKDNIMHFLHYYFVNVSLSAVDVAVIILVVVPT